MNFYFFAASFFAISAINLGLRLARTLPMMSFCGFLFHGIGCGKFPISVRFGAQGTSIQFTQGSLIAAPVKMSAEDFSTLQRAASTLWPDAIVSNSGIILGLAKLAAKDILKKKPPKPRR